jgi:iron-sulfur cluster repair protein YtfE (RIC family)
MPNRMDKFVSRGMGEVMGARARLHGLVGVFKTLAAQHGEASALLARLENAPDRRADLWPMVKQALQAHEKGELRAVFPELRAYPELREMADRHEAEAEQLDELIARVDATELASGNFDSALDALVKTIKAHVNEEETQIFPTAQRVIGVSAAKALEVKFMAAHDRVKHVG